MVQCEPIGTEMTAYLFNILDLLFTLYALSHGAVELNPLMGCVPFMIFYKVVIVGALLWRVKKRVDIRFTTAVYAVVNVWHIFNILGVIL